MFLVRNIRGDDFLNLLARQFIDRGRGLLVVNALGNDRIVGREAGNREQAERRGER